MDLFEELIGRIVSGHYAPLATLPPERLLAAELGVGRPALREAIARLEALGLIQSQQGSGTRVLDWRRTATLDLLPHYLRCGAPGIPFARLVRELLHFRTMPCLEVVRLAAVYAPGGTAEEARALVAAAWNLRSDSAAFAHADFEVYRLLALRSDFPPALWLLNSAVGTFQSFVDRFASVIVPPADYPARMNAVLDAVARRRERRAVVELQTYFAAHDDAVLRGLGLQEVA